jgi:RecA-family ATPase
MKTGTDFNDLENEDPELVGESLLEAVRKAEQTPKKTLAEEGTPLLNPETGEAIAMIREAKPSAKPDITKMFQSLDKSIELPDIEYIGGLFPRGGLTFLISKPGAGKSWLVERAACDLSIGGAFFNGYSHASVPLRSLILAGESGYEMMIRRVTSTGWQFNKDNIQILDANEVEDRGLSLELDEVAGRKNIKLAIECFKPDVLFVDSLMAFHSSDENKAREMKPIYAYLDKLAKRFNIAVVASHHVSKTKRNERKVKMDQDDAIGSSMLQRYASLILGISPANIEGVQVEGDDETFLVSSQKSRGPKPKRFAFRIQSDEDNRHPNLCFILNPIRQGTGREKVTQYIMDTFGDGKEFSRQDVENGARVGNTEAKKYLKELLNARIIFLRGTGSHVRYSVDETPKEDEEE